MNYHVSPQVFRVICLHHYVRKFSIVSIEQEMFDCFLGLCVVLCVCNSESLALNWFRCCPPRVGQLVKTTVTTAVIG